MGFYQANHSRDHILVRTLKTPKGYTSCEFPGFFDHLHKIKSGEIQGEANRLPCGKKFHTRKKINFILSVGLFPCFWNEPSDIMHAISALNLYLLQVQLICQRHSFKITSSVVHWRAATNTFGLFIG